jgi:YHS domain-containing protein
MQPTQSNPSLTAQWLKPFPIHGLKIADALFVVAIVAILSVYLSSRWIDKNAMPEKVVDAAEEELYLQPAGLYTESDIRTNGNQTASGRFKGFVARHDFNPRQGDRLCPITRTKANAACSWVIGGSRYFFCCPPCIDEFLLMAKNDPDSIKPPEQYVMD